MRDERLSIRGFGGSDAGVLAGNDPYRDLFDLVMVQRGELEPLPASERMEMGKFFEPGLIQAYSHRSGRRVEYSDITRMHPTIPHMIATPDALCLDEPRGVDAKLTAYDQHFQWVSGPPAHYVAQMQWYMKFFDFPHWDIVQWNGSELRIFTVDADFEVQDTLVRIAQLVWARYIEGGEMPPIGTTAGTDRWLKQRYPKSNALLRQATRQEEELLLTYAQVRDTHDQISEMRKKLENTLKAAVGDAEGIWSSAAKFTYKSIRDSVEYNWETLARKLMETLPEAERQALLEAHATEKKGSRRIHFTQKEQRRIA